MGIKFKSRIESDSLGRVRVPDAALYGAQTQRAINNFNISDLRFPASYIQSLALIKKVAAQVNGELGLLDPERARAIQFAASRILAGKHLDQFPIDIFQSGSGTSTNMNMNEVVANLCRREWQIDVHPNDHVNMGQSSNDVIPTAIQVTCVQQVRDALLPSIRQLIEAIDQRAAPLNYVAKTGRTHLMDAMPITLGQEMSAWSAQLRASRLAIDDFIGNMTELAQGGTAIGSGVNTHPEFATRFAAAISDHTDYDFTASDNFFRAISSQDLSVALSGHLKVLAVCLNKICSDLRWMNSGPLSGLGEIELEPLQPGSSIMPGKVNPVIPEAVSMACAQVIGNDATVTTAGLSGNFQLNTMLPVIAYNLSQSIELMQNACTHLAELAIRRLTIKLENIKKPLAANPILVTALNPKIGYEAAAEIAKAAYASGRPIIDVAQEHTDLSREELEQLLNPLNLTNV
ncbi:fumarate hydratase class II [Arenicella chitinivorans]|uniref:Fumarate hydratase class II n=1 Tax=Arenicella chitinivorans TaxID=1329800 RepID=A0A918RI41_9GAMM|nr:class II fumarate hydratase [Arenicella chitinivorans]GGZ97396.1 fumarate hydratase class II [Arenicella chitinivorans]